MTASSIHPEHPAPQGRTPQGWRLLTVTSALVASFQVLQVGSWPGGPGSCPPCLILSLTPKAPPEREALPRGHLPEPGTRHDPPEPCSPTWDRHWGAAPSSWWWGSLVCKALGSGRAPGRCSGILIRVLLIQAQLGDFKSQNLSTRPRCQVVTNNCETGPSEGLTSRVKQALWAPGPGGGWGFKERGWECWNLTALGSNSASTTH